MSFRLGDQESLVVSLADYDFDDMMASYECGEFVRFEFCVDGPDDDCSGENGRSGAGAVSSGHTGWQVISTLKMYPYDPYENEGAVTLFRSPDCTWASGYFMSHEPGNEAKYSRENLIDGHIKDNHVSSVMIPIGYTLTLCKKEG